MSVLQCEDISLKRQHRDVLRQVSLVEESPKLIGLLGPNGAGKTTLMRCIAGLQSFDHGSIRLDEQPLTQLSAQRRAQMMAYLPQERVVHWRLSVEDVVMLGRLPYQSSVGVCSEEDKRIVTTAMEAMDVLIFREKVFQHLSGGEQARVLIARTLAQQPSLLLADEPVNGLDPEHQIKLMHAFQRIVDSGCTVITSLHDLSLAARYCDRIVIMQAGEVVADGDARSVMTAETLGAVYRVKPDIREIDGQLIVTPVNLSTE